MLRMILNFEMWLINKFRSARKIKAEDAKFLNVIRGSIK